MNELWPVGLDDDDDEDEDEDVDDMHENSWVSLRLWMNHFAAKKLAMISAITEKVYTQNG